jgi:hypothetical protein
MDGSEFAFDYKQKVRLKNQDFSMFEPYAGQSTIGCEGWVTQRRRDRLGLPEVFIEWDQEHWRYNGVPNCWTYQEHFEPVEDIMTEPGKAEKIQGAVQAFTDMMLELAGEGHLDEKDPILPQQDTLTEKEQALVAAANLLSVSDAFVVIGVKGLEPSVIPYSDNKDAAVIAASSMSKMAAKAHENLALRSIKGS